MAGEWRQYKLGEIADIVGGSTPPTDDPSNFDGDVPWLTPKDLAGPHDRYVSRGQRNLSQKGLASCSAQLLPAGTILLTSRAPIGYVAIAKNPIATNQGFRNLIPRPGFDSEFIYYWVKANVERLKQHANGSTFQEITGSALAQIPIVVPPLPEQRAIAHILGTLDDKIELNRRMSETLEAMAQALFKAWFVDFEPVRAKMEGRWRRGESLPGLPAHLYDLFPDRLVPSELGEIPEGWEVGRLDAEFELTMGQSPPGETYNEAGEGLPFYQGRADFGFRFPARRVYCTAPTRLAKKGDTLVSVRAPVGDINMAEEDCAIGRGVAAVRHKTGSRSYTFYFMHTLDKVFASFEAEGTVFGSIRKKDFGAISCVVPPRDLVVEFERMASPFDSRIEANERESRTLAALRNALLPKLISGKIRVKDAEWFLRERGL